MIEITANTNSRPVNEVKISRSQKKVNADLQGWCFIDADTKQHVIYIPGFELTSYGATCEKAKEMLSETLISMFDNLFELKQSDIDSFMKEMGWVKSPQFNKQFSRVHVDSDGNLHEFNIKKDSLQPIELTV